MAHPLRVRRNGFRASLDDAVLVARPSRWGNPFVIGRDGDRATVITKYEQYLQTRADLLAQLPNLRGKRLACYCQLDEDCHGDVLARLANDPGGQGNSGQAVRSRRASRAGATPQAPSRIHPPLRP